MRTVLQSLVLLFAFAFGCFLVYALATGGAL